MRYGYTGAVLTSNDVIRRYYARFNAGDWDGMCALLTDDVIHDRNQGQRHLGRAEFRSFLDHMASCYRERLSDVVVMSTTAHAAARLAAEYVVHGEYIRDDDGLPPARGQRYILPGGAFFLLRRGRIARITNYYNLRAWLEQVSAVP